MTAGSRAGDEGSTATSPRFSAVVIHWNDLDNLRRLLESWDGGSDWELLVVDNSGGARTHVGNLAGRARWIEPPGDRLERNLGFAGGANQGASEAVGEWLLILNPDARPEPGALDELAASSERFADSGGLVPAMVDDQGASLHRWQLQRLPTVWDLLRKTLPRVPDLGLRDSPEPGAAIEQPAAAALFLRRETFEALGGFDPGFHPAWYEDVDLARRYADREDFRERRRFRYVPSARFVHQGGATLGPLGGDYPWIHFRNLDRYLSKHYPASWRLLSRGAMMLGALLRTVLYVPRLLAGRPHWIWGQLLLLVGILSGFRAPRRLWLLTKPNPRSQQVCSDGGAEDGSPDGGAGS